MKLNKKIYFTKVPKAKINLKFEMITKKKERRKLGIVDRSHYYR
jgi:hypothetical protein